jgi:anti-sigma regulatory factor (Ser/Thr protein kinase)
VREAARAHCATLSSDPLGLRKARRWLVRLVQEAGYTPQESQALGVAFSEACANVHRHAYGGRRDGRVDLRVVVQDEQVVVQLDHDGTPYDPTGYVPPDLRRPSESGYGLYLIRALVDDVSFEDTGSGGRVVLVKRKRHAEVPI